MKIMKIKIIKKNQIRKRDFDSMKEDVHFLNEKYNSFERIFENKLDFIESRLSKLIEKDEKKEEIIVENENLNIN